MNKYIYYKIIQTFYNGWWDVDFHETDSQYRSLDRALFKENLKAYRENEAAPIRVINYKELREVEP